MPRQKKQPNPFATEAVLCAAFIAAVKKDWTSYAETFGFDILLVRKADGFQIGIQAKLKLNVDVVNQAIEEGGDPDGPHPDCRAILVPEDCAGHLEKICDHLGLTVIKMRWVGPRWSKFDLEHNGMFAPALPQRGQRWTETKWHETATVERCPLPAYVPDVVAGAPSPLQLTDWKIKAIKIAVTLEMRGHVTRRDFGHHDLDHRRWRESQWLTVEGARFIKGPNFPNFRKMHPKVYKQIKADAPKWLPKTVFEPEPAARLPL